MTWLTLTSYFIILADNLWQSSKQLETLLPCYEWDSGQRIADWLNWKTNRFTNVLCNCFFSELCYIRWIVICLMSLKVQGINLKPKRRTDSEQSFSHPNSIHARYFCFFLCVSLFVFPLKALLSMENCRQVERCASTWLKCSSKMLEPAQ